jgi:DNA polymerase-3 subunit delta
MARKEYTKKSAAKSSTAVRLSDFRKQTGAEPKPVYILRGTDPYLMDQGRRAVRKQVLADSEPEMALMELRGEDAQLPDVLDALRTQPFLAPRRLVTIREAEDFVTEHRQRLEKYLANPSPCGSLCLEVASWNESTNLAKRVTEIGVLVQCEAARPQDIPPWLQMQAKRLYQKELTFPAAQMLVDYLGADFAALTSALDMLSLYVGPAPKIDTPDVDTLVARGQHELIWALGDAIGEHNLPRALELLDAFWAEGMAAPQIVGALRATFLRQLLRTKALARRMPIDDAMARAGVPYFARDRVRRTVRVFSDAHLADAYQALVDADRESKTSANERMALEAMLHRMCNPEVSRLAGAPGGGSAD